MAAFAAAVASGDEAVMAKMLRQKRRFAERGLAKLAVAVAAGDEASMAKMLRQKRRFAEVGLAALTAAVEGALRPGGVPALGVR